MENKPVVNEKQDFETATLLKKGKYGFYKQVNKIHSVYGDDEPTIQKNTNISKEDKPPVSFSVFKPLSETNHYLYPEKFYEFLQGFFTEKTKPFWSISKEGFSVLDESQDETKKATDKIDSSTSKIQDEGKIMLKKLEEIWKNIEDDVKMIGNQESKQSEQLHGFFQLIRDFMLLFFTLLSVLNVNSHPNIIDIIGETLTKMFVETDTGGMIDPEKSRLAISYFTMIAYAAVFIFIAYIASVNYYYFLVYEFGENIMSNTGKTDPNGKPIQIEWSLAFWWSYYEEKRPNLFGFFHALFYVVTLIDTLLRRIRLNIKGYDDYSPILQILIFLVVYYLYNYMVTITSSPVIEILFILAIVFSVLRICIFSYGSFSFVKPSVFYPPSMLNAAVTLIKIFVLFAINYALLPVGKLAVYAYIIFISFGIISFSETKRKTRGIIGRFFDTSREMRDYLLLNARILSQRNLGTIIKSRAHFIEKSWLSFSVILVFLFMFLTIIEKTKDFQMFAPIFYFILIFWGISIVKIILNVVVYEPWTPRKKTPTDTVSAIGEIATNIIDPNNYYQGLVSMKMKRDELSKGLSQNAEGIIIQDPNYSTGAKEALDIITGIGKEKWNQASNLANNDLTASFKDNISNPTSELYNLVKKAV